jgi:DNA uptake protein ComE-like DNA-binding protein
MILRAFTCDIAPFFRIISVTKSLTKSNFSRLYIPGLVLCLAVVSGCADNAPKPQAESSSTPHSEMSASKASKIDINTAPIAELDKLELPGTKPSLSERIQGAKPYSKIEDMVTKKAISAEEFKLIQNLVTVEAKK